MKHRELNKLERSEVKVMWSIYFKL